VYAPRFITVGSCVALLALRGVLIATAAAAVDASAALRVLPPLLSPLGSWVVNVGSLISLLTLGHVLIAIAAAVDAPAALCAALPLRSLLLCSSR